MRHTFLLLAILFASVNIMAQEHLQFMGIPIDGSLTDFCKKLEGKGFTTEDRYGNGRLLTGLFTGRKSEVSVYEVENGGNVYALIVRFEPSEEWKSLVNSYNHYKDLYTQKYGKPDTSVENNPSYSKSHSEDNFSLMSEVQQGTVEYRSRWINTTGMISLSIEKSTGNYEGVVSIMYIDGQNMVAKNQKELDDI